MVWNSVRNKNYNFREDLHTGKCSKFNKSATIYIKLTGKQICKNDLQPTFSCYLHNCSLLNEKGENNNTCKLSCSLLDEYKNNHNF